MSDPQSHVSGWTDERLVNRVTAIVAAGQTSTLQTIERLEGRLALRFDSLLREMSAWITTTDARFDRYGRELDELRARVDRLDDRLLQLEQQVPPAQH